MSTSSFPLIFYKFNRSIHTTKKQFPLVKYMKLNEDFKIEDQRRRIFSPKPFIALVAPCKINEGISRFLPEEMVQFSEIYSSSKKSTCFFIPASGSGSRMFDFLYDYLENPNDKNFKKALFLFNNIASFAFFDELSLEIKEKIKNLDISIKDLIIIF